MAKRDGFKGGLGARKSYGLIGLGSWLRIGSSHQFRSGVRDFHVRNPLLTRYAKMYFGVSPGARCCLRTLGISPARYFWSGLSVSADPSCVNKTRLWKCQYLKALTLGPARGGVLSVSSQSSWMFGANVSSELAVALAFVQSLHCYQPADQKL
jgi:hypothetical protein